MKRKYLVLLLIVILIAVFFIGCKSNLETTDSNIINDDFPMYLKDEKPIQDEVTLETLEEIEALTSDEVNNIKNNDSEEEIIFVDDYKEEELKNNSTSLKATLTVECKSIFDNLDKFDDSKLELLPEDGIIYETQTITFTEGDSVFDVLLLEMQNKKIHMEFSKAPNKDVYVEGVNNIYEFDCGGLSGWLYKVNGELSDISSSKYILKNNDNIEWFYSCDFGFGEVEGGIE